MTYEVTFPFGFSPQGGACSCLLRRFSQKSLVVLLCSAKGNVLLGDVKRVFPGFSLSLTEEEQRALTQKEARAEQDIGVFCRLRIPHNNPLAAGFDLSRLVLIDTLTGRGLCVSRPALALVSVHCADS